MRKKRIALYGGSFDPPHLGHVAMARAAYEQAELDEVWWVPCWVSPHKLEQPPVCVEERLEWVELAVRNLPWARVAAWEMEQGRAVFSYETAEHFSREKKEVEWFWLMGGDQWRALPTWREPERLAKCVTFLVMARDGVEVESREGYEMQVVRGAYAAASREIREAAGRGEWEGLPMDALVKERWMRDFLRRK